VTGVQTCALPIYEGLGFAEIAVRPAYYQPDGVDAVIMRLPLAAPEGALA
jgi:ribosomal protein S18 acetylase RimI-like enzyme